ncbi:phospholipid-translocating P-type ATPase [Xylona heveae TC161]|uniref:Phospholipid-transporting ATPase n=1 Tax=Xylona heveae (strain CBS 132557 / TC161) TaxID=1328760 RepID=A0A165FUL6_XYLHT|nr:phospholipid-translocating P-type ATPase [Xylona heveae TC161]KZF21400.1 phospholipid-translocating P-type ATPase [Xylona heveae TC161]
MPSTRGYYQPTDSSFPHEESDSDLDLEVGELREAPSTAPNLSSSVHANRFDEDLQNGTRKAGTALRSLRANRGRRGDEYQAGYGQSSSRRGSEEAEGLINDDDGTDLRDSGASFTATEDDVPLLPLSKSGRRRQRAGLGSPSHAGSKIRLPSFMSSASRPTTPREAQYVEEEPPEEHDPSSTRIVAVGQQQTSRFPPNAVSNAKYTPWSFLPRTLYNEFSFFFNMYFLLVALSQIIPPLRIGYLSTYIAPLAFVLTITLGKEALDDIARRRRDAEANSEGYTVLGFQVPIFDSSMRTLKKKKGSRHSGSDETSVSVHELVKRARDLKVGDVLKLGKDQRVPADVVILKSMMNESVKTSMEESPAERRDSENLLEGALDEPAIQSDNANKPSSQDDAEGVGETFIRTDQLDGETDWKLRLASPLTQALDPQEFLKLNITAGKPEKAVNEFVGTIEYAPDGTQRKNSTSTRNPENSDTTDVADGQGPGIQSAPLSIDNTAWANTVLASNSTVLAVVIYTGPETRQALSTSPSRSKTGLLENEINSLTKILCFLTLALSIILVALEGFESPDGHKWYVSVMRFLILFSTIVPISLRVNLDMGKSVYAWFIERDPGIPGAVVRTSTIPEDLGRVEYLLSDKTGTLTQNEMELKKIHVGTVSYANEAMDEVTSYVKQGFSLPQQTEHNAPSALITPSSAYLASSTTSATRTRREIGCRVRDVVLALALCHNVTPTTEEVDGRNVTAYQASSPDEIAIVQWTEAVGLRLVHRDRKSIMLQAVDTGRIVVRARILDVFPFTSEGKRMGIIVQFAQTSESFSEPAGDDSEIWFYQKGADTVMSSIVAANDWLEEETSNMAREGLRTLVVGRKKLSWQQYKEFSTSFAQASLQLQGRDAAMAKIIRDFLERDLELLGVTGVEDKLQRDVKPSLELLRNAGIKIWMLTGDKVETARCVAVSAKLVARGQYVHTIAKLKSKDRAQDSLDFLRNKSDACLLIDGDSLALMLTHFRDSFISVAVRLPAVIACRCSPTQKADVAKLIRQHTKKRTCCIGDGGNDVSMIQAADVGVGIVGKEGRQASLAADFSIEQFCHLTKLLVWHGRNSYKRSAKLAQFVIHRGLIISVCQTMFSIASKFEPNALYRDWLLVGYATVYTMAPVFSLVLDKDVDEDLANLYPELYKELTEGRSLSYRTFFIWVFVSIYQGSIIQGLSELFVDIDGPRMVAVSFTVLVINELIMVAMEITTWHPVMIFSLLGTALIFFGSIPFLGGYFDLGYVVSLSFLWRVLAILAISLVPPYSAKLLRRKLKPPSYRKVRGL